MRGVLGVIAGSCCAIVIACAADRKSQVMPVAPHANGGADPHAQIEDLSAKIASDRAQMGLPEAPAVAMRAMEPAARMAVTPSTTNDPQCHPGTSDTCKDSCTLADSICTNAAKICELATQLAGDQWAADKCTTGKATCDAAHSKCCGCQL